MNIQDIRNRADMAIENAKFDPKTLVMVYAGAVSVLVLLIAAVNFALDSMIDTTSGLSGMGLRAILSTAQSVLTYLQRVAVPFWGFGYTYSMMRVARGEEFSLKSLTMGFRYFVPLLIAVLLITLFLTAGGIALTYGAVMVLSMTPLAKGLTAYAPEIINAGNTIDDALLGEIMSAARPLVIFTALICALGVFYASYRYRMVIYAVLDEPKKGARYAMYRGRCFMRGHFKDLFLLDLSFWWYYLAGGLLVVLAYGDILLPLSGVELPMSNTVAFFLFYILYLVGQFALSVYCKNRVTTSYAVFYDTAKAQWEESTVRF